MSKISPLLAIMVFFVLPAVVHAQVITNTKSPEGKVIKFEKGSVFIIGELGSIITVDEEGLLVQIAGDKENRKEEFRDVDLRDNDRIFMLNGKGIKEIQELEDGYLAIGESEDIELGIKRDGIMTIVSFTKAASGELPKMHVITRTENGNIGSIHSDGGKMNIEFTDSEGSEGLIPVIEAGLIIAEKDHQVVVKMLLPNGAEMMGKSKLEENDIILSLQGKNISSSKQFSRIFSGIPAGAVVDLEFSRDGKTGAISFEKQEIKGNINVNIQN